MSALNRLIAIASVLGLGATVACGRTSPVSPDAIGAMKNAAVSDSSNASDRAQPTVFTAACDITAALSDFRTALGAQS